MENSFLSTGTRGLLLAAAVSVLTGCNALFDIHGGRPWPDGCTDVLTIDDLEDGNAAICETANSGKRHGNWLTISDGTSSNLMPAADQPFTPTPIPGGRNGSRYAAHMTGSGFTGWGALMGFNLNVQGLASLPYDARTTGGIKFWMKSNVPVAVRFPVASTIPSSEGGGTCLDSSDSFNCTNHFQYLISDPSPADWVEYAVPYTALAQGARIDTNGNFVFGSAPWNPASIVGVQFVVPFVTISLAVSFDVWVDDVRFYGCTGADCHPTCSDPNAPASCPAIGGAPAGCWPEGTDCATAAVLENFWGRVWGSGPDDVWTVGFSRVAHGGSVLRWTGTSWAATPNVTTPTLAGVWGSGPSDVWIVGDKGTASHWDGGGWTSPPSGTTYSLQAVWGNQPSDVWAVGFEGTILRWNGMTWSSVPSPTTQVLTGVWGFGANDVWAVGFSATAFMGVILRWNGTNWSPVPSGGQPLAGVWGSGSNDVWAVGVGIVHWDGSSWRDVSSPTDATVDDLLGVWGVRWDDVWAVGTRGTIVRWNGVAWSTVPSGTTRNLYSVWGSGPDNVWAVGDWGTIVHWNGTAWSVVPAGVIQ